MLSTYVKLYSVLQNLFTREEGQDLIEYALVASLIALGCVAMITSVGAGVLTLFTNISTSLAAA